jgi:hypothetical protein
MRLREFTAGLGSAAASSLGAPDHAACEILTEQTSWTIWLSFGSACLAWMFDAWT